MGSQHDSGNHPLLLLDGDFIVLSRCRRGGSSSSPYFESPVHCDDDCVYGAVLGWVAADGDWDGAAGELGAGRRGFADEEGVPLLGCEAEQVDACEFTVFPVPCRSFHAAY